MSRCMIRLAVVLVALTASSGASLRADQVPGLRGHDHTGVTVPDMAQAVDFFVNVLGCKQVMSFGPFADENGNFMKDLLNVNPRAVIHQITQVRCGYGSNIELFQYSSPDQKDATAKNSDIGGFHIAFYVDDIDAAKTYLDGKGVRTFYGPFRVTQGPAAGQGIFYFLSPWGLQMEMISYPKGMAYEASSSAILWSPKDPGK
jgi:catechol 2,3-dioxygenase-like lactoylglutathione lyase family enzyme